MIRKKTNPLEGGSSSLAMLDLLLVYLVVGISAYMMATRPLRLAAPLALSQAEFWRDRAAGLCLDRGPLPLVPLAPMLPDAGVQLKFLQALGPVAESIWAFARECEEPRSFIINEDLLRFKFDCFDEFDQDENPGFEKIYQITDEARPTRSEIFVIGHTDETGTDEYNYALSFKRAWYVAMKINAHLAAKSCIKGIHYQIFPVGMGKTQLLPRLEGQDISAWQSMCRRIELLFRSSVKFNSR